MNKSITDYVEAFTAGKEWGFNFFFKKLYRPLLYYAFRFVNDKETAEDFVEDAFIKIWERHSSFSHHQVISAWLYTTVRNGCLNYLQLQRRQNGHKEIIAREQSGLYEESVLAGIITAEVIAEIHTIMKVLPAECRKVFELMYIKGMTARETSEELMLHISTIKNQKSRGLDLIKKRCRIDKFSSYV